MSDAPRAAPRARVLLLGGTGQVGRELLRALAPVATVTAPTRRELDLRDLSRVRDAVRDARADAVVNAAACTAVDRAEREADEARVLNADLPGVLAEEAARLGAPLVHFSTDYVFDGRATRPYREDDEPAPLNVYGETKLAGERRIGRVGGPHLVVRTSWVFGPHGTNFYRTMRRMARERPELRVVSDQVGVPTWSRPLAEAAVRMLSVDGASGVRFDSALSGVYHIVGTGRTSWFDFARAILEADPGRAEHVVRRIVPVSSEEYGAPARRPSFSVLDPARARERFGVALPDWRDQLAAVGTSADGDG